MSDLKKLRAELLAVIDKAIAADTVTVPPVVLPITTPGYTVRAGKVYDPAGKRIQIRGVSMPGWNGDVLRPTLLWVKGQDWIAQLEAAKALGFNSIRVPFTPDTLYDQRKLGSWSFMVPGRGNDLFRNLEPLKALDAWMAEADRLGFYLMLDFHSISMVSQYGQWFTDDARGAAITWNAQPYTKADWLRDLKFVANRYKSLSRFFAIDIYNEPNGKVRWDVGDKNQTDAKYYWKPAAEEAAKAILSVNQNLLIFVQGIQQNFDGIEDASMWMDWGSNLQPQSSKPLSIPADKLVLSNHVYGYRSGVSKNPEMKAADFPANMPAKWEKLFGQFFPKYSVIPGEWGGRPEGRDKIWLDAFVTWMLSKGMTDNFFWAWANSGDTGAVIDDNYGKVIPAVMEVVKRSWG